MADTTFYDNITVIEADWLNDVNDFVYNSTLDDLAGLTPAANKFFYYDASATVVTADLSSFARTILDDASAAAMLTTLGAAALASPTFSGTVTLPAVTMTGDINMGNHSIFGVKEMCYNGVINDGTSGTAKTINFTLGAYHTLSMTDDCTFTLTAPTGPCVVQLEMIQSDGGTAGDTMTLPGSVKWPSSYAAGDKILSTGAGDRDLLILRWNGTDYVANLMKDIA